MGREGWGGKCGDGGVVVTSPLQILLPPSDVPSWLKSLRLHKYAALFSQMTYEEMMTLTEHHLESQVSLAALHSLPPFPQPPSPPGLGRASHSLLVPPLSPQNVTKGARHKIALSIQKLRERQSVLKALEKVSGVALCPPMVPSVCSGLFSPSVSPLVALGVTDLTHIHVPGREGGCP